MPVREGAGRSELAEFAERVELHCAALRQDLAELSRPDPAPRSSPGLRRLRKAVAALLAAAPPGDEARCLRRPYRERLAEKR